MTCDESIEIAVLGGGPGGYAAALEAAALGKKTALIEQDLLGGTCLNRGCIPTKLLLGATSALPELGAQARLKLLSKDFVPPKFDLAALHKRKERMVGGSRKGMVSALKKAGVLHLTGRGKILGPNSLEITDGEQSRILDFDKLIIAVGSQNKALPNLRPDGRAVLDSTALLALANTPETLLVVGSGAIGLELGEFWSRMGSRVTLVEAMDRLAPREDPEVSKTLTSALKRAGWTTHTGTRVARLATKNGRALLTTAEGTEIEAERALVAVGRAPQTEGLGLDRAGVRTNASGWIETDDSLRAAPHIYAVGDCNGRFLLAHPATHQAKFAARHAAGVLNTAYDPGVVPFCIYGSCEAMRVGPTAEELRSRGEDLRVSKAPLAANAIAQAHGASQGFVKAFWVNDTLRGVCAVGHGATSLVMQAALLVTLAPKRAIIENIMFAHPTLDEALSEALLASATDS